MQIPLISSDEQMRLATLKTYDILDTPPEQIFDEITATAAEVCEVPTVLLCFVDRDRQWFKSSLGFDPKETSRDVSFCAHALHKEDVLILEDSHQDVRFASNPLVTGDPHIRFYAGMPLIAPEGKTLGTLCVIDSVPRRLRPDQLDILRALGRSAMHVLDLRRKHGCAVLPELPFACTPGVTIADAGLPGRPLIFANKAFCEMTGYSYAELIGQPCPFLAKVERSTWDAIEQSLANKKPLSVDVSSHTKAGELLWNQLSLIPYLDSQGTLLYVAAVYRDITVHKRFEVQRQKLHAMRTTMATVNDIVFNFMNNLRWYRMQMEDEWKADAQILTEFDGIFEETMSKLGAINGLEAFKEKLNGSGSTFLDTAAASQVEV